MLARRWVTLAAVAVVAFVGAEPAHAAVSWESSRIVSVAERDNSLPDVAVDAQGGGVAIWRSSNGTTRRIEAAVRAPGGNFSTPLTVREFTGNFVYGPAVAMDRAGNAVAAWYENTGTGMTNTFSVRAAFRAAGAASFGASQSLGTARSFPSGDARPAVAIDRSGNAIVVAEAPAGLLATASRPAGGGFGSLTTLPGSADASGPDVAFDPQGAVLAAWSEPGVLRASSRAAGGGAFSAPQTISTTSDGGSTRPDVKFDAAGNAVVAWITTPDDNNEFVGYNTRAAGQSFGTPREAPGSAGGSTTSAGPQLVHTPSGSTLMVFNRRAGLGPSETDSVMTSTLAPGGAFSSSLLVDGSSTDQTYPQLGIDASGEAASVWLSRSGSTGSTRRVLAATRGALGSSFGGPQALSATGDFDANPSPPRLAVSESGQAIAVWARVIDGNVQVEAAFGTPPGAPPPPPPPPPPQPPVPSAIQLARTAASGKATVLSARVSGPVTAIRWAFGNNAPTITSYDSDAGGLKTSVRLRPRNRNLSVTLTAFGPGGASTFQRSFTLPPEPDDRTSTVIRSRLDQLSDRQVVAVGDANVLTGSSSGCGQLVIKSARQTMTGCFRPVDDIGDIPSSGRGVLAPLAAALRVDLGDGAAVAKAVGLSDGYAGSGRVRINGTWPVVTRGGAALMHYPQAATLASANARFVVAGREMGPAGSGLNFPLDPASSTITLGDIPIPSGLSSIGDFPLFGYFYVILRSSEAEINTVVRLPSFVQKFGNTVYTRIQLRGNADRLLPTPVSFGPDDVDFGALRMEGFSLALGRIDGNEWVGGARACVLNISCFDLKPPDGSIVFRRGTLAFAGLTHSFGSPGKPIAPGAFLETLSAGFGLDPSRLIGAARIGTAGIVKVDGKAVVAFPSGSTPYVLDRREVGDNFPAAMYGARFTRPTVAGSADLKLALPIGEVTLGGGYLAYEFPGYAAFGGGFSQGIAGVLTLTGGVSGEFDVSKPIYNLHGDIRACVVDIVCGGAVAHMSQDGQGNGGVGACVQVGPVSIGGGKLWKSPVPKLWPLDGCKWSPFRLDVRGSRAAQAGGGYRMTVKRGQPNPVLQLSGQGGAPMVQVTGPGGQVLDSTGAKLKLGPGGRIRIVRFENAQATFTSIGLQDARPGTYTVTLLPDSVPVTQVARSADQLDAKVRGKVTGTGTRRVLSYEVRRRAAQSVTFYEAAPGGAAKAIGTVRGGRGKLRFDSAPGRGTRRIEARFTLSGLPAELRTVTRFKPVSPVLAKVRSLSVKRSKRNVLRSTWGRVPGATRYEVAVTLSNGTQLYRTTRKPSLVLRRLPKSASGRVGVRAMATMRTGTVSSSRFKRLAPPARRFRAYRKCTVSKKKVSGCGKAKTKTKAKRKAKKR